MADRKKPTIVLTVRKPKPKRVSTATIKRVEAALDRAMTKYADYVEREVKNGLYPTVYTTDHPAFWRARVAMLRLLREARRG